MIKLPTPNRVLEVVRRRGLAAAANHALRRIGTVSERALVGPDLLRINPLGHICNHACPMCFLQHMPEEELKRRKELDRTSAMTLADYAALLDGMPPGLEEVNIVGGGEPLAHSEIVAIMGEIKKRGLRGSLISNGTLMKESVARRMVEIGWNSTRISVHAGDAATYERVQAVDRFEILRKNLKTFDRLRVAAGMKDKCELVIFHVIQRDNLQAIDKLFEFGEEVHADSMVFERVRPLDTSMELAPEELKIAEDRFTACARATRIPCNAKETLQQLRVEATAEREGRPFRPAARCSVGFDQAFITSMGDALPCCYSNEVMGNVREETFKVIWGNEKYQKFRRRLIQGKFAGYCIENRCALAGVLHN